MTPQDRLAYALLAADDLDPGFANDLAVDDDAAPEMARILTIADEWLSQDLADGAALRLLREALPDAKVTVVEYETRAGRHVVVVGVEKRRAQRVGRSIYQREWGEGPTIAEAADACREALES